MEYLYAQLGSTMEVTDSNSDVGVEMVELDEGFDGDEEIFAVPLLSELQADEDMEEVCIVDVCMHVHYIHYNID